MRATDTSIAAEVLAEAQEYGTVVPTNIVPGPFLQLATDNTDINEETLDGKNTTHATSMVVFQRPPFGPEPPPIQLANHSDRRLSLQGEEFMSYKNVLHLEDNLKSVFVMVKFKKNGSKEKMNYFDQQVVLMKYGKS